MGSGGSPSGKPDKDSILCSAHAGVRWMLRPYMGVNGGGPLPPFFFLSVLKLSQ